MSHQKSNQEAIRTQALKIEYLEGLKLKALKDGQKKMAEAIGKRVEALKNDKPVNK